jgi:hypothetical protein
MKLRYVQKLAMVVCVAVAPSLSAYGDTIVFDSITGAAPAGSDSISALGPIYASFDSESNSGPISLLELVLREPSPPDSQAIDVGLYADNSATPGALISTLGTISDSSLGSAYTVFTVNLTANPDLISNARYWIGLTSTGTAKWAYTGDTSGAGVSGQYYSNSFGTLPDADGPYMMQVALSSTAVPEPSAFFPLIGTAGILAVTGRKRLRAQGSRRT